MVKFWLLRVHRWIAVVFAIPLAAVIVTGLILSFEPIVQVGAITPGSVKLDTVEAALAKADPGGTARALTIKPQDGVVTIGGGRGGGQSFSLATGEPAQVEPSFLSGLFGPSRGVHERLVYDLGWLVVASTYVMLALPILGVLMGWPRIRNTVGGWHKATGWGLLPLMILSPLTGLALAYGITLQTPAARPAGPAPTLAEAVRLVAADHDLSRLVSIGQRGPTMMARVYDGGELRAYAVTKAGLAPLDRNLPRLIHEGNWAGLWSGLLNVVTSIAMLGLLVTGLVIWSRRTFRRRLRDRNGPAPSTGVSTPAAGR
jgi:hypothetical protein